MTNYAISLKRTSFLLAAIAMTAALTLVSFASIFSANASAAQLQSRSLELSSTLAGTEVGDGIAGSETNGSEATHTFVFTMGTSAATIRTILLKYCLTPIGACAEPTGIDTSAAGKGTFVGVTNANWSVDAGDMSLEDAECDADNCVGLTATGDDVLTGTPTITLPITNVVNPDEVDDFYVRIFVYGATSYSTLVDDGTVASAITDGIAITSRVKETLGFSTTGDIDGTNVPAPTSACVPLLGTGAITLGDPAESTLDITTAYDNYSAFRVYTNASAGVTIQYEGDTLRKDVTNSIDANGATGITSATGDEQFGLAIDTVNGGNAAVAVASESGTLDLTNVDTAAEFALNGALAIDAEYDNGNGAITSGGPALFAFVADTPTTIASSTSYVECKTAAVRYIANIDPLTPAGTYTTTVVYSAVPIY